MSQPARSTIRSNSLILKSTTTAREPHATSAIAFTGANLACDLLVGETADHRARVCLRVPAVDGVLVPFVDQQPLAAVLASGVHEDEASVQLLALHLGVQLA